MDYSPRKEYCSRDTLSLGQQYNVGEKPTLILLYTNINRHAEPPNITKQKTLLYIVKRVAIMYDNKQYIGKVRSKIRIESGAGILLYSRLQKRD